KLVAFRDSSGAPGLVTERCPHRGASMFFGRNEDNGLRCVYHGWKFGRDGRCVDMPSEPPESNFKSRIRITAYPCVDRAGLNWSVECMIMPFHKLITFQPGRPLGAHMWVPSDDETCMNWSIEYQPHRPLEDKEMDRSYGFQYIHTPNLPGTDRMQQNPDNDYL